ncbi:hypothetical protein BJF79_30915 [Actinomadura sp. CNU-125]|uniref:DUF6177 family protein n=1 Tax=Actinomadura sp. CNU-125 TaxID=1904961 RepID=UPI000961FDEB|nr:DUF6177 family protein [Actinomadura sp. CNU-125]OLT36702.1 hypothetical protein BJF79_30915 [Actinomadura sp. CNU-125]
MTTVDLLTERVGVVMQNRPVVSMSSWMAEAVRVCSESGRGLQVVTPPHSRLTLPLRLALNGPECRWVVTDPGGGFFDGSSGAVLDWDGERFVANGVQRESARTDGSFLVVNAIVRHTAYDALTLGVAAQTLCESLGGPPVGWGTSEPAANPWDVESLTRVCRDRAPRGTWLVFAADGPVVGTMTVTRTDGGVQESITVGTANEADPRSAAERLAAGFSLVSVVAQRVPGRNDLTVAPENCGPPLPVGFGLGPEVAVELGELGWFDLVEGPDGWDELARIVSRYREGAA